MIAGVVVVIVTVVVVVVVAVVVSLSCHTGDPPQWRPIETTRRHC